MSHDDDLADPAGDTPVRRCLTCGGIGDGEPLLDFQLLLLPEGKAAGRYRLCGACYRHANPPQLADPLDVTNGA